MAITLPPVDIVVPIYRNLAVTRRCVESVLAHTDMTLARLILVDDATPEPELAAWCDELGERDNVLLLRHERNQGFVVSVNLGMSQSDDRDVVLLNSDTEVPAGWLERMRACAASAEDIATVTPFSNNGSICSYPVFCQSSDLPEGLDLAALNALFAQANRGKVADLPTAVGFCMYIRRECLNRYGLFDAAQYGRGYGEENDFSLRVAAEGWRNCLCADLLVYHQGAVSFGDDSSSLMVKAEQKLVQRYPDYIEQVAGFVARDPLQPLRAKVDILRETLPGQLPVLLDESRRRERGVAGRLQECRRLLGDTRIAFNRQRDEYEQLLADSRTAYRQQGEDYEARCVEYDRLLAEAREAWQQSDQALHETRQALATARQRIERLDNLTVIRLGRWIKRNLLKHDI